MEQCLPKANVSSRNKYRATQISSSFQFCFLCLIRQGQILCLHNIHSWIAYSLKAYNTPIWEMGKVPWFNHWLTICSFLHFSFIHSPHLLWSALHNSGSGMAFVLALWSLSLSLCVICFSSPLTSRLGSRKICVICPQTLEAFQTAHYLTHAETPIPHFSSALNTHLSQNCQKQQ